MANLSVRKLNNDIVDKLRLRALQNGVSMEEEIRQILTQAASTPDNLGDVAIQLFGEDNGVDLKFADHPPHQPINLF